MISVCTELIKKSLENSEKDFDNGMKSLLEASQIDQRKKEKELDLSKKVHENVSISESVF